MTDIAPNAPVEGQAQGQGEAVQSTTQTTETKAWYDGMADEDVGYIQNKAWKAPSDAVKAYKELEAFRGVPAEQLLKLPKDLSDPNSMNDVYSRLGRPPSPDKYDYKAPDNIRLDEGRMSWAKETAHKLGLNNKQFADLTNLTIEYEGKLISEAEAELTRIHTNQVNDLKKEWGNAFQEREVLAQRAVKSFITGTEEQKQTTLSAIEGAIGTAAMLKLFANIGERMGEDRIVSTSGDTPFGYTPQQALSDKKALMAELADPANKSRLDLYNQGKGKDYDKMQQLIKLILG